MRERLKAEVKSQKSEVRRNGKKLKAEVEEEGRIKAKIIKKLGSNDYVIWDKEQKKKMECRMGFQHL